MDTKFIIFLALIATINCRKINDAGLQIIKQYDTFQANFYNDLYGVKTIGYGHRCLKPCDKVKQPIDHDSAEKLLRSDLEPYEECVEHYVPALNDDQYSALVSFAWTMGCGSLRTSILLHYIKAQNFIDASSEFTKFVVVKGEIDESLVARRILEKQLFCRSGGCSSS